MNVADENVLNKELVYFHPSHQQLPNNKYAWLDAQQ